jgi:hypothetical protein
VRRGSQVVRQRSAKPLFVGSIPTRASNQIHLIIQHFPILQRKMNYAASRAISLSDQRRNYGDRASSEVPSDVAEFTSGLCTETMMGLNAPLDLGPGRGALDTGAALDLDRTAPEVVPDRRFSVGVMVLHPDAWT